MNVQAQFEKPPQELDARFYTIQFQGEKLQLSLEEMLSKIEDKGQASKEAVEQPADPKAAKKDTKKGGKEPVPEEKVRGFRN